MLEKEANTASGAAAADSLKLTGVWIDKHSATRFFVGPGSRGHIIAPATDVPSMTDSRFRRFLELSEHERRKLLDDLNRRSSPAVSKRAWMRYPFPVSDIPLCIEHPSGGQSCFLVFGRNLSRHGMSVLHGGYVHPSSKCSVILRDSEGHPLVCSGIVRHCELISGYCHQLGIWFPQPLDVKRFVSSGESTDNAAGQDNAPLPPFTQTWSVLIVDSFEPDRLLLEHQLRAVSISTHAAATSGAAIDLAVRLKPHLVLVGLHPTAEHGLHAVSSIHSMLPDVPIVMLLAETDVNAVSEARRSGASTVLGKPFSIELLIAQLRTLLGEAPRLTGRSTAEQSPGMAALIARFVDSAHRVADRLEVALHENAMMDVRAMCCWMRGSGIGYGFQDLSVAAMNVLVSMDRAEMSSDQEDRQEVEDRVRLLAECCRAVEAPQTRAVA